jgi:phospholipase/carboxylesterase
MSSNVLDCIRINPESEPSATVIWLHGLGADGHDFEPIIPELNLPHVMLFFFCTICC